MNLPIFAETQSNFGLGLRDDGTVLLDPGVAKSQ
jgi:hypothetical protein